MDKSFTYSLDNDGTFEKPVILWINDSPTFPSGHGRVKRADTNIELKADYAAEFLEKLEAFEKQNPLAGSVKPR